MKDELIRYNMEDCIGLKIVVDFINQANQHQKSLSDTAASFVNTNSFEKEAGHRRRFGTKEFLLDEFDFINRCSYFDYQRDRMSARDARRSRQKLSLARKVRLIHRIMMFRSLCFSLSYLSQ